MQRHALPSWALVVGCLFVTGCERRIEQGPARSIPKELEPATVFVGHSTRNVFDYGACPSTTKVQLELVNLMSKGAGAGGAADVGHQESLAVKIEWNGANNPPALDYDKPLRVILINNSDQAIRIWDQDTENGYYQLSFQFKNQRTGEVFDASKRRIDDKGFWKAIEYKTEPGSVAIEIAPRSSLTTQVEFGGFAWGHLAWIGLPGPNSNDRFAVSAQFESAKQGDGSGPRVWAGKIQSTATNARVVAPRLKTPHDYLWNGFPRTALEMMAADPKWISAKDENSCTPLHHAARFAQLDVVKWLLAHGADVNAIAYNGFTPLHMANDVDVIKLILQKHPDLSVRCRALGQTPLQRAVDHLTEPQRLKEQEKWRRIVKLYIDSGAEYDILTAIHLDDLPRVEEILKKSPSLADDSQDGSPLRTAAALGRLEICRYLIEKYHVDVDDFERGSGYPIIKGALAHPRVVELLIRNGADLKTRITWRGQTSGNRFIGDDATALHYAADFGVPETIKLLVDNGVDIFATTRDPFNEGNDRTAIEVAVFNRRTDNLNTMLSHPKFAAADPQLRQRLLDKCLRLGAGAGPKIIEVLLDKGADPNTAQDGATTMQMAARGIHPNDEPGNTQIRRSIALLKERGAPMDLFSAVAIGDEQEVERLLRNDPKVANSRGPDGYPALHFAVGMNYKNIVAALLRAGGEVDIRNKSDHTGYPDETALHAASFWRRYEIAKLLIDAGADVNAVTDRKSTPLHSAARMSNIKVARLLLEKGAKPDARDKNNETPLDWCRRSNSKYAPEMEKLLHEYDLRKGQ